MKRGIPSPVIVCIRHPTLSYIIGTTKCSPACGNFINACIAPDMLFNFMLHSLRYLGFELDRIPNRIQHRPPHRNGHRIPHRNGHRNGHKPPHRPPHRIPHRIPHFTFYITQVHLLSFGMFGIWIGQNPEQKWTQKWTQTPTQKSSQTSTQNPPQNWTQNWTQNPALYVLHYSSSLDIMLDIWRLKWVGHHIKLATG